jgi:putative SOS response-associated peptidase YedK
MCGRYRLSRRAQVLRDHFGVETEVDWSPRYNIAPTQPVATIHQHRSQPKREFSLMRWGLIPYWSKDAGIGARMINARAETVASKAAFREPLLHRRCLMPADGFYEWKRDGRNKQPYCFATSDDSLFAFAGLWDRWRAPDGTIVKSCTILTTTPNALMADVHDRMPVILPAGEYDLWLDPGFHNEATLCDLLKAFDSSAMRRYPVSARVNNVENDEPDCSAPLDLAVSPTAQATLFEQ